MRRELENNFEIYKRDRYSFLKKAIFGFIGLVITMGIILLNPPIPIQYRTPVGVLFLISFWVFFPYFIWALGQRPSAEKRIFANFYKSLKHFDFYTQGDHKKEDLDAARKYLQKAVNLIRKAPSNDFKMVDNIIKKEIDSPLGSLANNINSRLIPPASSAQIKEKLKEGYKTIEKIALAFSAAKLKEIKKINVNLKNFSIIPDKPYEKSFTDKIRSITQTKIGLFSISIVTGYIVILTIVLLLSIPFGWRMSDPSIGGSVIVGGAAISTIVYLLTGKTPR